MCSTSLFAGVCVKPESNLSELVTSVWIRPSIFYPNKNKKSSRQWEHTSCIYECSLPILDFQVKTPLLCQWSAVSTSTKHRACMSGLFHLWHSVYHGLGKEMVQCSWRTEVDQVNWWIQEVYFGNPITDIINMLSIIRNISINFIYLWFYFTFAYICMSSFTSAFHWGKLFLHSNLHPLRVWKVISMLKWSPQMMNKRQL